MDRPPIRLPAPRARVLLVIATRTRAHWMELNRRGLDWAQWSLVEAFSLEIAGADQEPTLLDA